MIAAVLSDLVAPPARVLEVGAGRGELAAALRARGYAVRAIDPEGDAPGVEPVALHELRAAPASFDAAVAVLSLHHVEPLRPSLACLAEVVRPGGRLLVDEFDVAAFDERAARWWIRRSGSPESPASLVGELREHLHPLARLRTELARHFTLGPCQRGPYLNRWELPPGLEQEERALIAAGALPATGARFTGRRRGPRS